MTSFPGDLTCDCKENSHAPLVYIMSSQFQIRSIILAFITGTISMIYDNINSIIRTLSGKEAPKFPDDLEDKLVCMFMRTIEPFEKFKGLIPSRNNYLSYPYVIRKLLRIVSYEENNPDILHFEQYFSFLKSRQKMWDQEKIWQKICDYNEWPFFRSI